MTRHLSYVPAVSGMRGHQYRVISIGTSAAHIHHTISHIELPKFKSLMLVMISSRPGIARSPILRLTYCSSPFIKSTTRSIRPTRPNFSPKSTTSSVRCFPTTCCADNKKKMSFFLSHRYILRNPRLRGQKWHESTQCTRALPFLI